MFKFRINTEGAKKKITKLEIISKQGGDQTFWKDVLIKIQAITAAIFRSRGTYASQQEWKQLAQSTANAKYRKAKGGSVTADILRPSGTSGFYGTFKKLSQTPIKLIFGSDTSMDKALTKNRKYSLSAIHQLGLGRNPKRRHLYAGKGDVESLKNIYSNFILRKLSGSRS